MVTPAALCCQHGQLSRGCIWRRSCFVLTTAAACILTPRCTAGCSAGRLCPAGCRLQGLQSQKAQGSALLACRSMRHRRPTAAAGGPMRPWIRSREWVGALKAWHIICAREQRRHAGYTSFIAGPQGSALHTAPTVASTTVGAAHDRSFNLLSAPFSTHLVQPAGAGARLPKVPPVCSCGLPPCWPQPPPRCAAGLHCACCCRCTSWSSGMLSSSSPLCRRRRAKGLASRARGLVHASINAGRRRTGAAASSAV